MRSAIRLALCIAAAATFAQGRADEGGAATSEDKQVTAPRDVTAGESTRSDMGEPRLTRTSLDAAPARTDMADAATRAQEEERINEIWTAP